MKKLKLNRSSLGGVISFITELVLSDKTYQVNVSEWSAKRGLSANAQQHVWYKIISNHQGVDIREAGNMSKLDFGLPILLADEKMGPKVSYVLDKIKFYLMTREQQVNVMDLIQVTSLFSTKQHNLYRDQLCMFWHGQGLNLEYKND